jgi:serine/threonine-protein kinase
MSPEGLRGDEMTPLSDQYSLGVLMYECATGRGPFMASTLPELVRVISSGEYQPPNEQNPNLSKRLTRIIMRAMSLDPQARFKDTRELGRELLLLSGQRTRITWGLSFGEGQPAAPEPKGDSMAPLAGSVPPPPAMRANARRAVPWILAGLSLLILLRLLTISSPSVGRVAELGAPSSPNAPAPRQSASAAIVADLPRVPERAVVSLVPPALTPPPIVTHRSTRRYVGSSARALAPQATPGTAAATANDTPEWALPSANLPVVQSKPREQRPISGSNGAPIFD